MQEIAETTEVEKKRHAHKRLSMTSYKQPFSCKGNIVSSGEKRTSKGSYYVVTKDSGPTPNCSGIRPVLSIESFKASADAAAATGTTAILAAGDRWV